MTIHIYNTIQVKLILEALFNSHTFQAQYRWKGYSRQMSDPLAPEIDPKVFRRDLQNPVRAIYNPRSAEVGNPGPPLVY